VPFAENEYPVGDLGPGGEHESFGISVRARAAGRDLHDPDASVVRVRGDPEDVHVTGADLDDGQAVQPLERHRAAYVEEGGGEHRGCLGVQELPPGRVGAPLRCGRDLQGLRTRRMVDALTG
jgi:hypothetical protein